MSPVQIHDKTYWTVAERLKLANGDDNPPPVGVQSIATTVAQVGNLTVVRAEVVFADARHFSGHSLVNLSASSPAERDAPLETAETSAVGRALAMAGYYGSPEGIAGAEEIHLAQQRAEQRQQRYADGSTSTTRVFRDPDQGTAAPRPVGNPSGPSPAQVRYLQKLWGDAGRPLPPPDAEGMPRVEVSRLIDELKQELGVPSGRPIS